MKSISATIGLVIILLLLQPKSAQAQSYENAGEYMDYITQANEKLTATYLSYLSAVAHNKSARKQEKRREEVLNAITETRYSIQGMLPWKGDKSYRDTTVAYLKILNSVFNEDYSKIVNMEEIAEQSYDAMEAYMLAQEKAGDKLEDASHRLNETTKAFAKKNDINLVEGETEISKKSKIASEVNKHYNEVYLIFFKPFKQEAYLMDALEKGNLIAIEQNNNALEKMANDGQEKLKTIKVYNKDASIKQACNQALAFYESEAKRSKKMTDYFLKKESFESLKKNFDAKRQNNLTQKDVNEYNNAVNDMNAALNDYNNLNQQLNKERTSILNNWNKNVSRFFDQYMPVQKKQ